MHARDLTSEPNDGVHTIPWRWLAAIFVGGFLVRLVHAFLLRDNPYFDYPIIDAKVYHDAALAIANGSGHPDDIFWQPPGYSYFMAALYKLIGTSALGIRIAQAILGGFSAAATAWIGARFFGPRVGVAAGSVVALYGTMIYFDGELLTPTLTIALQLSAVALYCVAKEKQGPNIAWVASGVAGGLAAIVTVTSAVFVLVVALFAKRNGWLVAVGAILAIAPVTIRNAAKGGEFVAISSNGGINYYIGNNPDYDATVGIRPDREWRRLTSQPAQDGVHGAVASSNYFVARSFEYLVEDPVGFGALQLRKAYLIVRGDEFYRNQAIYPTRRYSPLLGVLLWKFPFMAFPWGILLPLGLVGAIASGRRGRFLVTLLAVYALAVVAFFVTARYRLPMVPYLAILAAEGVRWLRSDAEGRRRWTAIAIAVSVFCVANIGQGAMRPTMNADAQYSLAVALARDGDLSQAEALYRSVIEQEPDYAEAWINLGIFHAQAGRLDEAEAAFETAAHHAPWNDSALLNLASLKIQMRDYEGAARAYRRILERKPNHKLARENLRKLEAMRSPGERQQPQQ